MIIHNFYYEFYNFYYKKSPSALSDSTDQKSNVTEQNPKLNIGRESILSSIKQTSTQVDKAINLCPKNL